MHRHARAALALTALLLLPAAARAGAALGEPRPDPLVIGILPELNIFKQRERFRLLGDYLSEQTGLHVQFTILSRYGNIIETLRSRDVDGAFLGSFTGALAIARIGVVPIARPVNLDGTSTYHGYVFVRRSSGIASVAGMRGKRMAFVDRATTAGYVFPLAYLKASGVADVERFFGETYFTGSHDAAIDAVLKERADVGAAKHSVYERVRAQAPRIDRALVILAESPPVPSNGLCVRSTLAPSVQATLRRALLGLHLDPKGAAVLAQFGALRFIETTPEDYRPVAELARSAGIDIATYEYRNE